MSASEPASAGRVSDMNKLIIALGTIIHLLPHPFGVSSIGATALYAGAYGRGRTSWLIPLIPLSLGLFITGLYEPTVMIFVFAGYALSTLAGYWFLRGNRNLKLFGVAVVTGALIFYLVSNFSIWLVGFYPMTVAGLVECYVAGLPYLGQAALADAAYCFVFFGLHNAIKRRQKALAVA